MPLSGFGNHHQSEAMPGALPTEQNSPQQCPLGLYAEQLSGSAFTRTRNVNYHSWLYRHKPSVGNHDFKPYTPLKTHPFFELMPPIPMRWTPFPTQSDVENEEQSVDFIEGLFHMAGNAVANTYLFQCTRSMITRYMVNRDGEMLFIPYQGHLRLITEFGTLTIKPGMIAVIPRGIIFKVDVVSDDNAAVACGYLCENFALPFTLPHLGLIGSNGLAHPRHFIYPDAATETVSNASLEILCKYQNHWWIAPLAHTPFDVVAWHGNYAPYSYDLALFNTINTVSFDHPDPSIFTVLTSESSLPGIANLDFVIFPPRWMVAEHTFRPPYFHRNVMSELMGLIRGVYDAKPSGFCVGGLSIHNGMTPHGPDENSTRKAQQQTLQPEYLQNTLAFMLESCPAWQVTELAWNHPCRDLNYAQCWSGL